MPKPKVVLTGATGYLAGRMRTKLQDRYDLTMLDVKSTDPEGNRIRDVHEVDLINRDRDQYRELFRGADAVVHSGFKGTVDSMHTDFWKEVDNVTMCYNVYQTCIEEGVRRLVMMSSNHAADYYERLIWSDRLTFATPEMIALSDNYYGWGKISYEALGFIFATGQMNEGKILQNVQLRIGAPRESVADGLSADNLKGMHRNLGAYLSARDQVQLIVKSIETENIEDQNGVPFQIFYGISGNTHRFWTIENARRIIGYKPEDDSAIKFADKISFVTGEAHKGYE
ncbi:MAG TPA: NAD(P)-dependent oxidoreductase [Candidatus Latescibacteria bacterium]|nr:NAD-dependent dehydratase [Gemmatimonadota bacterium]HCR18083.1 NAD(P)-dependent oxidoreductase [Candidatus Latescibacterota bacterium]|tara:strand:+ start:1559 stop:2410 length:852 start_codon:yes stop_codon:yes gene_type:complete